MTNPGHKAGAGAGLPPPADIHVRVAVPLATPEAHTAFSTAVQNYAFLLAGESQRQELSLRPPGGPVLSVSESAVLRGGRAMSRFGERAKPDWRESAALFGSPVFTGVSGLMSNSLHSPLQVGGFVVTFVLALACMLYLVVRRLA